MGTILKLSPLIDSRGWAPIGKEAVLVVWDQPELPRPGGPQIPPNGLSRSLLSVHEPCRSGSQ